MTGSQRVVHAFANGSAAPLSSESHVYTSERDLQRSVQCPPCLNTANLPSGFVRLVYCLGYGENRILASPVRDPSNGGTPQYWKIFYACLNAERRATLRQSPDGTWTEL